MEQQSSQLEFCNIEFRQMLQLSKQIEVKIVGMIKSVFSSKKYIIQVSVRNKVQIRSIRTFNEFEATYEVIKMKFKNFNLGQFPSKYQVFGKDETRKQYFQWFIIKIFQNYNQKPENEANKRLVSLIYLFLTKNISHPANSPLKKKKSLSNISNESPSGNSIPHIQNQKKLKKSLQLSWNKSKNNDEQETAQKTKRRNSEGSILQLSTDSNDAKQIKKIKNQIYTRYQIIQSSNSQFQIKFENQLQWKRRYLKIQGSSLMIFKDKMENNFRTKIELFRIKVEYFHREKNILDHFCQKMQISNEPTFSQNTDIITISHEYDYQKLMIKGLTQPQQIQSNNINLIKYQQNEKKKIRKFKQLLQKSSQISPIKDKYEGVFNPIGKIFLVIHKLNVENIDDSKKNILNVKIKTSNLQFQCKKLLLKKDNMIKQGFFIPISNTFQTINIQAVVSRQQGWIREQFKDFSLGYYPIEFSQILTKPQGTKYQKINVALKRFTDNQIQNYDSNATIEYSLENYSHFSSIYSQSFANQNDGKIISGLKFEDMDQLSVTVDRALRIIGNIALFITAFWRNVYLFKYPNLSRLFFGILLLLFWFAQIKIFISIGFGLLIAIVLYHHPKIGHLIKLIFDYLFFEHIHPNFIPPLCLGTSQIKYRKWCQALQQIQKQFVFTQGNRLQRRQKNQKQNAIEFVFKVHDKKFIVTEQVKGILGKVFQGKKIIQVVSRMISGVVNTIEKISNMFLWVDGKRTTLLLFILVIFSGVTSDYLLRLLGSIFCVHRLYKGLNFYKFKHYPRNRKIAIYTLRYIINRHFPYLIPNNQQTKQNKKIIISLDSEELIEKTICNIQFPIFDDNASKKLKSQLEKLICVYLDVDQLQEKYHENKQQTIINITNQNHKQKYLTLSLSEIIQIIQTCQTRLQLDWVPGQQGLSNQFQELKQLTKQSLLIDVWLEHLLINYVLNIPSHLFYKLKGLQSKKQ